MHIALALGLSVLYAAAAVALGGTGGIAWFIAPAMVSLLGFGFAAVMGLFLPVPWVLPSSDWNATPRRVHLSSRIALRLAALVPLLMVPLRLASPGQPEALLRATGGVVLLAASASLIALARHLPRQRRLVERGLVARADILRRTLGSRSSNYQIHYEFNANGRTYTGKAIDIGYGVREEVPVFVDPDDPARHVAACACWFEVT